MHEQHTLLVIVQWLQYVWFVTEVWLPYIYLKISMVCFQLGNYYLPSPIIFFDQYLFWLAFWMCNGIGFNNIMIQMIKKPLIYVLVVAYCLRKASPLYVAFHYLKDTTSKCFCFWVNIVVHFIFVSFGQWTQFLMSLWVFNSLTIFS